MELVLKERGSTLVTIKYCQQRIPTLRKVSRWAVARALRAAGYHWLRRRRKRWVAPAHVAPRLRFGRLQRRSKLAIASALGADPEAVARAVQLGNTALTQKGLSTHKVRLRPTSRRRASSSARLLPHSVRLAALRA